MCQVKGSDPQSLETMASAMAPSSLFSSSSTFTFTSSSSSSSSSSSPLSFHSYLRVFGSRNALRIGINRPTIFVVNALAKQQPSRQNAAKPSSSSKRPADLHRGSGDDDRYRSRNSSNKNVSSRNQNSRSSGNSNRGTAGYGYGGGGGNVKREQSLKREQLYRGGSNNSRIYVEEVVDEEEEEEGEEDDDDE